MRDLISVDRVANKIRLLRSTWQGTFLLVEGPSDKIFYERFTDNLKCQLVVVSGKPSSKQRAIDVLKILEKSDFKGVLAIVDADFDRLITPEYYTNNLFCTDTHDLEGMLIKSPAFDKVLAEFGSEQKIRNFDRDIRLAILKSSVSVGYLLWISQCDELNLTFEGIKFSGFINEQNLEIDELQLIHKVKNKSQAFSLKDEDLQLRLNAKKSMNHDPWQICCGHHLVEILSFSLRKTIGSNDASNIEPDKLERSLRLAYEEIYFLDTQLYKNICNWEANNQPFKVLKRMASSNKL